MLKALYDYGIRNQLAIPPGFMRKPIRAYILLSHDGDYLGVQSCENETQICPDVGSLAQGPDKCNPLAEKAEIILEDNGKKPAFFRSLLQDGRRSVPAMGACLKALESETLLPVIREDVKQRKIKGMDRISFKVDGMPITEYDNVQEWWTECRSQYAKSPVEKGAGKRSYCLITGQLTVPLETVPTVNGLQTVGGHSKGEALICFDKAAFQSYGLKKSANAPVSEEAFSVVKDALNDLLAGSSAMYRREKARDFKPTAPVFAGMKFVHWYDCSLEPQDDVILPTFDGFGGADEDEEESDSEEVLPEDEEKTRRDARGKATRLVESIRGDQSDVPDLNFQYHILLISGANGRAMIRRYEHGSYQTLRQNLEQWNQDIALCDNRGGERIPARKLTARLMRLVKVQKGGKNPMDQMKKELAGMTPAIVMAIINGSRLPDAVAYRALTYIRSQMLAAEGYAIPDGIACQWLKVWLVRKNGIRNEEVAYMETYQSAFPNAAYHCGALTAVYANLQKAVMGDVGAGIVQRYYASASQTPALVLGTLERMAGVYIAKEPGLARAYENHLNQIYSFFEADGVRKLPSTLNLEAQSYFALGYRQMCAQIQAEIEEKKAQKQEEK